MRLKIEEDTTDANVFIYGKMGPDETNLILFSKVSWLTNQSNYSSKIALLQENGSKLWLIRDSRVEGLLTVQSISWNKEFAQWQADAPQRFMLSNDYGWVVNNACPESAVFLSLPIQSVELFI